MKISTANNSRIESNHRSHFQKSDWHRRVATAIGLAIFGAAFVLAFSAPTQAQAHDDAPRELSEFSASEAFDVKDGLELDPNSPLIKRLLYRVLKTSYASRAKAYQYSKDVSWKELDEQSVDYRFWMLKRRVQIERIEKHVINDATEDDTLQHFFICEGFAELVNQAGEAEDARSESLNLESPNKVPVRIVTRTIPEKFPIDEPIREPVEFEAFYYAKVLDDVVDDSADTSDRQPSFVFVADRLAWFPNQTTLSLQSHTVLAELGFDVSLLDTAKSNQGKTLQTSDTEAFFQMLRAMKFATGEQAIHRKAMPRSSLTDVLTDSSKKLGSAIQMSAVCRSCTLIEIPYLDVQQRLGIDHYYQLVLFPKLDRKVVMIEDEKKVELDRYAVTVCCTSLPEGMEPKDIERRQVSIDGFFYRVWKFETEKTDMAAISGAVSPLIIASTPTVMESSTAELNRFVVFFVLGVIGIIGVSLIYLRFSDRMQQANRKTESILDNLPDRIDTEGLDVE